MESQESRFMVAIVVLAAALVAAHGPFASEPQTVPLNYIYWVTRFTVESLLFFFIRSVFEDYLADRFDFAAITSLAIAVSHLPFVLSVTAFDIALGYPELGIEAGSDLSQPRLSALMLEMVYLADNHVALCLLLSIPRWMAPSKASPPDDTSLTAVPATLLSTLDPPLDGDVIWVEAQEHYVRITTPRETRMILARFSDILRELSTKRGMQVHRSHWVLETAIVEQTKSGQNLNLILSTGDTVPVSRSYRKRIEALATVTLLPEAGPSRSL
jgi:hypothetical protein